MPRMGPVLTKHLHFRFNVLCIIQHGPLGVMLAMCDMLHVMSCPCAACCLFLSSSSSVAAVVLPFQIQFPPLASTRLIGDVLSNQGATEILICTCPTGHLGDKFMNLTEKCTKMEHFASELVREYVYLHQLLTSHISDVRRGVFGKEEVVNAVFF